MLAPDVLARIIPVNLRSQIRLVAANTQASYRDRASRLLPASQVHPTKYAFTTDLSHYVLHGNRLRSDGAFASVIGYGRGILMTFRMRHNMELICVDRKESVGKPPVS
jgi:hypothetical protein